MSDGFDQTHFASTQRRPREALESKIRAVTNAPLIDALFRGLGGLLAVLDENRQIIAVNDEFIAGLSLPPEVDPLGLRPGEALVCVHAHEMAAGCGTSRYCATCGAALAIVAALAGEDSASRKCVLTTLREGRHETRCFSVHSTLFALEEQRLVLLWMVDITREERLHMLERTFSHDISNLACAICQAAALLRAPATTTEEKAELTETVFDLATRMRSEIEIEKHLAAAANHQLMLNLRPVTLGEVAQQLSTFVKAHPTNADVTFELEAGPTDFSFATDLTVLLRVLTNMLINAFEASDGGDLVRLRVSKTDTALLFAVWNRQHVPPEVARRVFEAHFSTKPGSGRGLGTYSMRVLGEEVLGGSVELVSSKQTGTTVIFRHPLGITPSATPS